MYYSPLCAPTAADAASGTLAAQPEYHGLAAVHQVGTGSFLTLSNPAWATVRAYAVKHADGTMTVVLDNVQDPAGNGPSTLQLDLGATFTWGSRVDLTASALTAQSGITLGGAGAGPSTTLASALSGKCLSVLDRATADGSTADIYTCDTSPSQNWTINPDGTITGGLSGKCLQVANGSTADFAGVDIATCTGAPNQLWSLQSGGTIVGAQSGRCLSVTGASTTNQSPADIYDCNGSPSENWTRQ